MKIRTKTETKHYRSLLEEAIDRIEQATDSITYTAYPEVNQRLIAKLEEAICTLEEAAAACVFKP